MRSLLLSELQNVILPNKLTMKHSKIIHQIYETRKREGEKGEATSFKLQARSTTPPPNNAATITKLKLLPWTTALLGLGGVGGDPEDGEGDDAGEGDGGESMAGDEAGEGAGGDIMGDELGLGLGTEGELGVGLDVGGETGEAAGGGGVVVGGVGEVGDGVFGVDGEVFGEGEAEGEGDGACCAVDIVITRVMDIATTSMARESAVAEQKPKKKKKKTENQRDCCSVFRSRTEE
ncbi:hypothetical protein PIB30_033669 [Stylosanthes scabra]|uniref:Uncharacterized protein n=1 Tax=Stylosanthes scabra TaxID=79078 RepID=A0ABU6UBZ7_9FABA|nr:hypothetical protein [Stylosanthes scabra]